MTTVIRGRYLVESVGKGFFCARGSTEDFPVVYDKLVSARGLLALRNSLERPGQLDRCLELQRDCIIGFVLGKSQSCCLPRRPVRTA